MPANFDDRKAKILAELSTPDEQYQDLSPKGSVDAGIRDLIAEINAIPDYVTTSSCAGRIAVYLEGVKGAKGGGQWLYTSHDPVEVPSESGEVLSMLGLPIEEPAAPSDIDGARFVHFKYEPMVCFLLSRTATLIGLLGKTRENQDYTLCMIKPQPM
jgi:tRNA wybutosine-synthesizing protein 3